MNQLSEWNMVFSLQRRLIFLSVLLFSSSVQVFALTASQSPIIDRPDVFQIESTHLANGLQLIKKRRFEAKNVVVMIAVEVGLRDFPCGKQQIAHVLEHMLFTGTSEYTEREIKRRIEAKAGELKGYTYPQTTYYYVDIHSGFIDTAFDTLYKMLTDSQFDAERTQHSVDAVHAELGTSDNLLRQAINDRLPVFERAVSRLYPESTMGCEEEINPSGITLQEVTDAYQQFYHASNMSLIVVGDFDDAKLQHLIEKTFATMPLIPAREPYLLGDQPVNAEPLVEHQRLLSIEAEIGFALRTVGRGHPDAVAIKIIAEFLDDELFSLIRSELGLGYTPKVSYRADADIGNLYAHVDTTYEWIDAAQEAMEQLYQRVRAEGLSEEEFGRAKEKRILELESKQFTNEDLALELKYYRHWIAEHGNMRNTLAEYRALTNDEVNAVINKYFLENPVYGQLRPHTTSSGLILFLKFLVVAAIFAYPLQKLLNYLRKKRVG